MTSIKTQSGKASSTLNGIITGVITEHILILVGLAAITFGILKGKYVLKSIGGFIVVIFLIASFCGCIVAINKTKRRYLYTGGLLFAVTCITTALWGVLFFHGHIADTLPLICLSGCGCGCAVIITSVQLPRRCVRKKHYKMVKMTKKE